MLTILAHTVSCIDFLNLHTTMLRLLIYKTLLAKVGSLGLGRPNKNRRKIEKVGFFAKWKCFMFFYSTHLMPKYLLLVVSS